MKISKNENKIKTVFNIYEPLIPLMKSKLDEGCLKRDVYLDKALLCESGFLRKEVTTPNSVKAKNYILKSLKELELKPVNLLLSKETVDLMNEVCKEKNIPRDAFVNRVFLLLIASNMVIDALFFGLFKKHNPDLDFEFWGVDWDDWGNGAIQLQHYRKMNDCFNRPNIFDSIKEFVEIDPFWRLRDYFSCYEKDWKLYGHPFEKDALSNLSLRFSNLRVENTIGFNTFISDDDIPKQEPHESVINDKAETIKLLATMEQEDQERQAKIDQLKKRKGQNEHD